MLWHNLLSPDEYHMQLDLKPLMQGLENAVNEFPELEIPPPRLTDIGAGLDDYRAQLNRDLVALYNDVYNMEEGEEKNRRRRRKNFEDDETAKQNAIKKTRAAMSGFFKFEDAVKRTQAAIGESTGSALKGPITVPGAGGRNKGPVVAIGKFGDGEVRAIVGAIKKNTKAVEKAGKTKRPIFVTG